MRCAPRGRFLSGFEDGLGTDSANAPMNSSDDMMDCFQLTRNLRGD
ncbi:hypothetical protein RISK_006225 [Rhodopirellula islandica]|uniref:Uncharacterized protein n=1 Tax=Rhodopirellula islandica TaxID=595434 RepID=A0A0J1B5E9_RHOIS|nr:hypothetical protein RISK_006225 [Rhodopirellula islandica]